MKKYIYLVTLDWSFDGEHGLETYPFHEYDAAYSKFKELITHEIETSWLEEAIDEDGNPNDGYDVWVDDNNSGDSDVYFCVTDCTHFGRQTDIELQKKEIL